MKTAHKRRWAICVTIVLLLLVGIGLTLFFLWYRNVTIDEEALQVDYLRITPTTAPPGLRITSSFTYSFRVDNPNYAKVYLNDPELKVWHASRDADRDAPVYTQEHESLEFSKRKTQTKSIHTVVDIQCNSAQCLAIQADCIATGQASMKVRLTATGKYLFVSRDVEENDSFSFPCVP
jgi:hypothetical protein